MASRRLAADPLPEPHSAMLRGLGGRMPRPSHSSSSSTLSYMRGVYRFWSASDFLMSRPTWTAPSA